MKRDYTLAISLFLFTLSCAAAPLYRHVPFSVTLNQNDSIVVDYNYTAKMGVYCTDNHHDTAVLFTYKGFKKTAILPAVLQNAHIPPRAGEELADISGQFTMQNDQTLATTVTCHYVSD